jgi:uncharacterized protein (DUF1697 family)
MYVALLRGINVGGKAKLPMRELSAIFAASGATNVQTYIQSGNVVFEAGSEAAAGACVARVTAEIARVYGYPGRIVLRSAKEMRACLAGNPFAGAAASEDALHVYFLAHQPDAGAVKGLDPGRSSPDEFVVRGREGSDEAVQCLLRFEAEDGEYGAELADRGEAGGDDVVGGMNWVASSRKAVELRSIPHPIGR